MKKLVIYLASAIVWVSIWFSLIYIIINSKMSLAMMLFSAAFGGAIGMCLIGMACNYCLNKYIKKSLRVNI